jgi:adenine-specific DNA-methyltransferase
VLDQIESALGRPAYREDGVAIYEGDCQTLLKRLPSEAIGLTITSPPYNIGKEYESVRAASDYIGWCADWIASVYAATRASGTFWLDLGYMPLADRARAIPIPYLLWDRVPFYLTQEVVWHYDAKARIAALAG